MNITITDLFKYRSRTNSERYALFFEKENFTYGEIYNSALKFAQLLINLGVTKGDRIAIIDYNTPSVIKLIYGSFLIGAIPVLINWRFITSEIEFIIKDSGSKIFFFGNDFLSPIQDIENNLKIKTIQLEDQLQLSETLSDDFIDSVFKPRNDNELIQLYTSGTTGYPKGVILTHESMISMLRSVSMELPGFGANTVNLVTAPLFNIAGIGYLLLGLYVGAKNVVIRKFQAEEVIQTLDSQQVTNAFLAPAMIQSILHLPDVERYNLSALVNIHYGGSPMSEYLIKKTVDSFKCHLTQGYGLTETTGITTLLRYDDHVRGLSEKPEKNAFKRLSSAGKPVFGMNIEVRNEDGTSSSPNKPGEIFIKGNNLAKNYWNRPTGSEDFLDRNGWFPSGDIGMIDENGYLFLLDRKNDMIISKGVNIYPAEIERILIQHPQIRDIAIIGIPDDEFGETVCAIIVKENDQIELTLSKLREWSQNKISSYKLPRKIIYINELPRNPSGKVLRHELKKDFWKGKERNIQ